jgi:hypothetical protein
MENKENLSELSGRRRSWLMAYLNPESDTFFNAGRSAKTAGYNASCDLHFRQIGYVIRKTLKPYIDKYLDEAGLSNTNIKMLLLNGVMAEKTIFFGYRGQIRDERAVPDWQIRIKFIELACKVKGLIQPNKISIVGSSDLALQMTRANERLHRLTRDKCSETESGATETP